MDTQHIFCHKPDCPASGKTVALVGRIPYPTNFVGTGCLSRVGQEYRCKTANYQSC